ncbi:MAG: nonstructural protein [Arizlama microvirus]|nr:MAG: nonstructural protein [Arizlama microvirus]
MKIFAIFDIKANAYLQPFFLPTNGMAIRSFETACNDNTTQFNRHPMDYTLFELGSFDDSSGALNSLSVPIPLGSAKEYIKPSPQMPLFNRTPDDLAIV